MKPELISFKLCPFVQRAVIVLLEKGVDFDLTFINLQEPPDWFKAISPFGKVPVLRVGEAVIFESAVIMEYLDEVNPPSLHPVDAVTRAVQRAWMEFASNLFMGQFRMVNAKGEEEFNQCRSALRADLERLEPQLVGPWFGGEQFQMVDAAFAPFFVRAKLVMGLLPSLALLEGLPQCGAWSERLLARPSVQNSVPEGFEALYRGHLSGNGSHFAGLIGTTA